MFFQEGVHGGGDGLVFLGGGLNMEGEAGVGDGGAGGGSESAHGHLALLEIRVVLLQRGDSRRTEEDDHVVLVDVDGGLQVGGHGFEDDGLRELDVVLLEEVGILGGHGVGTAGNQVLVFGILQKQIEHAFRVVVLVEEDFAFAELDVFLEVEGHLVGRAEILHLFRKFAAQLFYQTEEIVHGGLAGEDDRAMVENVDVGFPELAGRDAFDTEELEEIDVDAVFPGQVGIGRLVEFGGGVLGDEDVFYFHKPQNWCFNIVM